MIFSIEMLAVISVMVATGLWFGWLWALVQLLCFICLAAEFLSLVLAFGHARDDGAGSKKARWVAIVTLSAALLLTAWLALS